TPIARDLLVLNERVFGARCDAYDLPGSRYSTVGPNIRLIIALLRICKSRFFGFVGTTNKVPADRWSIKETGVFSSKTPHVPSRPRLAQDVKDDADEAFSEIFERKSYPARAQEGRRLRRADGSAILWDPESARAGPSHDSTAELQSLRRWFS